MAERILGSEDDNIPFRIVLAAVDELFDFSAYNSNA